VAASVDWVAIASVVVAAIELPTISLIVYILKKLGQHDTALALIIAQVNPVGAPSLQSILNDIKLQMAREQGKAEGANHNAIQAIESQQRTSDHYSTQSDHYSEPPINQPPSRGNK
jgi:hypothetical protein